MGVGLFDREALQLDRNLAGQKNFEISRCSAEATDDDQIRDTVNRGPADSGKAVEAPKITFGRAADGIVVAADANHAGFIRAIAGVDIDLGIEDGGG